MARLQADMHINCASWKATDAVPHQPGTRWVTEGLTVPMATTSSFSKVKDLSSSHPVARQWMICFGQAVRFGCGRNGRDAVYIKPARERKTRWKLVANWWAIINSFRKTSKTDPSPKRSWLQIPCGWYVEIVNSCISPRRRKRSSNRWAEHPVRGSIWCKLLHFLIASALSDVHYWSYRILKNANDTVAVNRNVNGERALNRGSCHWCRTN